MDVRYVAISLWGFSWRDGTIEQQQGTQTANVSAAARAHSLSQYTLQFDGGQLQLIWAILLSFGDKCLMLEDVWCYGDDFCVRLCSCSVMFLCSWFLTEVWSSSTNQRACGALLVDICTDSFCGFTLRKKSLLQGILKLSSITHFGCWEFVPFYFNGSSCRCLWLSVFDMTRRTFSVGLSKRPHLPVKLNHSLTFNSIHQRLVLRFPLVSWVCTLQVSEYVIKVGAPWLIMLMTGDLLGKWCLYTTF